jgi:hypothetical protein
MQKKIFILILPLALIGPLLRAKADDSSVIIDHPVDAYHMHRAESDATDAQIASQQAAEAQARYRVAKKNYEESLEASGADNTVTQEAKKRLDAARNEYLKYSARTSKDTDKLKKDAQQLKEDMKE